MDALLCDRPHDADHDPGPPPRTAYTTTTSSTHTTPTTVPYATRRPRTPASLRKSSTPASRNHVVKPSRVRAIAAPPEHREVAREDGAGHDAEGEQWKAAQEQPMRGAIERVERRQPRRDAARAFVAQAALLEQVEEPRSAGHDENAESDHVRRHVEHEQRTRHERFRFLDADELRADEEGERDGRDEDPHRVEVRVATEQQERGDGDERAEAQAEVQGFDRAAVQEHARDHDVERVEERAEGEHARPPCGTRAERALPRELEEKQGARRRVRDDAEIERDGGEGVHRRPSPLRKRATYSPLPPPSPTGGPAGPSTVPSQPMTVS